MACSRKSPYTLLRITYLRSEYQSVEKILRHIQQFSLPQRVKFPVHALLRAVSRTLLINSVQWLYLGLWLEGNNWQVDSKVILKYKMEFPEVVFVSDAPDEEGLRALTLFLYLAAYSVKQNICNQIQLYHTEMRKLCPKFKQIHQQWVRQQPNPLNFNFDMKNLNKFSKRVSQTTIIPDYNLMVDQIINIAPCYNTKKQQSPKQSALSTTEELQKSEQMTEGFQFEDPFDEHFLRHCIGEVSSDLI